MLFRSIYGAGCWMNGGMNADWGYAEMFLPQALRGISMMFIFLPINALALGTLPPEEVQNASGLFNLMRNLGGAIGIALIDTVIFTRSPAIVDRLVAGAAAGDGSVARTLGMTPEHFTQAARDDAVMATVRELAERQAIVETTNEAWLMLAAIATLALVIAPFARAYVNSGAAREAP